MRSLSAAAGTGVERVTAIALFSLPVSFDPVPDADLADVVAVSGSADWAAAAGGLLGQGSKKVIVVHPEPSTRPIPGDLRDVIVDSIWASNPAVPAAANHFLARIADSPLLQCRIVSVPGRSIAANLLDAATLVRALVAPLDEATLLSADAGGALVKARAADLEVIISIMYTSAAPPNATVQMLTIDGGVEISIPDPESAKPAIVTITTPDGAHQLPTIWESGHRAAWRRAHDSIGSESSDLANLAADQSLVSDLAVDAVPRTSTNRPPTAADE